MPNIAQVLKAEIARVARKEGKGDTIALKAASARYRSDIAALKRQVAALERAVSRLARGSKTQSADAPESEVDGRSGMRWRPDGFKKLRARLELSAADMGKLIGCSGQSVYKWEDGKARPRKAQLEGIARVRKMGKKEARAAAMDL